LFAACKIGCKPIRANISEASSLGATLEWVDWFNHRRLLEPIGNMSPAELEAPYYHPTSQLPMTA
jgi:hypothetical protein